jgi:hypothetical protein
MDQQESRYITNYDREADINFNFRVKLDHLALQDHREFQESNRCSHQSYFSIRLTAREQRETSLSKN